MTTVLTNAIIFTANDNAPFANTVAFDGEKIVYVGKSELNELRKRFTDDTKIIDLNGKMIVPGFIDSHAHPGMVSQSAWHIRLPWTEDVDELLDFVREYAAKTPKEEAPFLYFEYYPTSMFGEKGPTKELLDTAVSDRPCLCQDFGEHLHWVNSKMIELLGVTKDTPDPVPGLEMFVRDENGEPTGWVKEFAWNRFAERMYEKIKWRPPMDLTPELMRPFFAFMKRHGITALADALLEGEPQIASMYELDKAGELSLYYDGIVRFRSLEDLPEKIAELKRYREKYATKRIKFNTVKLFLDGTNESGNSALLAPHLNDPSGGNYGEIKMEKEELKECFLLCNREGLDLHIHMVGDRAFREACDAVELARAEAAEQGEAWVTQPIFAHCELIDPLDMPRAAELGITVNWSCHWSGGYFGEEAIPYIGKEAWERMYQFNPIIDSGALVTFSSDVVTNYELHRAHPFFGMQVANTRIDPEYPLDAARFPGSVRPPVSAKLGRETLLKGYTINGAKQMRWADKIGSIETGKLANLNILTDNYFEADAEKVKDIDFEAVIFEGEVVYGRL